MSATTESRPSNRLRPIDIVAIVIGVLLFLCGLELIVFLYLRRRKNKREKSQEQVAKSWDPQAFVSAREKDPLTSADWQGDLESLKEPPSAALTNLRYPDIKNHAGTFEHRLILPVHDIPPTPSNSRFSFNQLTPLIVPQHQATMAKATSESQRSPVYGPPLSRQDSVDDIDSEDAVSVYSQPSAMLSRGPSQASKLSRTTSLHASNPIPPVPNLADYFKKQRTQMEDHSFDPSSLPNRHESEPTTTTLGRQSTFDISNLIKTRTRHSQSPPASRSTSPVSHIERSDSIKPPIGPPVEPQVKEPYGRRVRRMKQELSATLLRESKANDAAWESVPLR